MQIHNFEQHSDEWQAIKHIVKPAIGDIFNIKSCVSEACNSYAFQLNEHLIVKFAKDEKSLEKLLLEKDVLSFLKGKTNLRIPENDIFENHFTFTIHNMIKGDTFQNKHYLALSSEKKEKFCFDIALFMYELHTLTNKILKLMNGENNRAAKFVSFATFVGNDGTVCQFERFGDNFEIAYERKNVIHPDAWSDLWQVMYMKDYGKMLCEFSKQELSDFTERSQTSGSLQQFAKWFLEKY